MLTLIVAVASHSLIGRAGKIPWHLPEDLRHFKALTMGHPIIMGRKTWESLPGILPGRPHIVVTRNPDYQAKGATVATSLESAQQSASQWGDETFVIGGAALYALALPCAHRLCITEIHADFGCQPGDVRFPEWNRAQWKEISRERQCSEKTGLKFDFVEWRRH